jgi:hypothetical protein
MNQLFSKRSVRAGFRLAHRAAFLVCLALLVRTAGFSQAVSGDVTGAVSDASGAAVEGAAVTAENESTGVKATEQSNHEGVYRFTNLPIGSYSITASATGFAAATLKSVQLVLNNVVTANLTLAVGTNATTVEVSAAGAVIDTTTAQLQTTFDSRQTMDLPAASSGSGIYNLTLLGAGVASSGGVGQGAGPAIAGQRPDNNVFTLDGVSNQNHYDPAPLVYVANDAVSELSLLQNQFSPEFGGGSGGIFNVIVKTGTNKIHGSIYEYMQNRDLDAVDAVYAVQGLTSLPRYDNNRLGATVGGPIVKNKLFYFGNFEYNPVGRSAVPGTPIIAPTSDGISILNGISGLSSTNLGVFEKYVPVAPANDQGTVTVAGLSIPVGTISTISPSYTNSYNAVVALDYDMSEKDQLRGRWVYNKTSGIDTGAQLPVFDVTAPNDNYFYSLSEFHNFAPTLQNEFRASFSRNFNTLGLPDAKFGSLTDFPNITIEDLNSLNIGPDGPSGSVQNLFQLQDNMSKIVGKHTLKFGYHFTDVILTNYFIQRVRGDYYYYNLETFLEDLSPDEFGERSAGPTSYPVGFLQNEAFFNDDFKVRPNLTVNLGLRYEYDTMPIASRYQVDSYLASVPGGISFGRPFFGSNDWSPRFGFAYTPGASGNWVVRGGFSKAFDFTYANLTSNSAPPYFQQTNDVVNSSTNFLASGGLPGNPVPLPNTPSGALGAVSSYTYGGKRPYGLTWTLGVQRIFAKNYVFEARYVGTRGVHLWNQSRLNIYPQVTPTNYLPTFFTMPSSSTFSSLTKTLGDVRSYIVPGGTSDFPTNSLAAYGSDANIVAYLPQATSTYNGLAVQLTRSYSNGLTFIGAYTWSHTLDDATATNFSTYLSPRRAQDYQNLKADWASSALDHRQRFTFSPIYDWKPFKGGNWFLKNLVGNWNIAGTYTYQSPELATVQSGLDANLNGDSAGDRAIINSAGAATASTGVTAYNSAGQAVSLNDPTTVAYVANSSNARYVQAGYGALANGGRNTFPLKPIDNIDAALSKKFDVGERFHFTIGAQFYNVLNHSQFVGGYTNDIASNGNTTSRNDLVTGNPLFGRFDQFYSSNSRVGQIVAHFEF